MNEMTLVKGKGPPKPLVGIDIEGAVAESGWTKTAGVSTNAEMTYMFAGSSVYDYIRIPYANTPYPNGENMELRMKLVIYSIANTALPVYLITKYTGATTSVNTSDWTLQRRANGNLAYNNAASGVNPIDTGKAIPLNEIFELRWVRVGNSVSLYYNDELVHSTSTSPLRSAPIDWMIGAMMNAANNGTSTNGSRMTWSLVGLRIKRLN